MRFRPANVSKIALSDFGRQLSGQANTSNFKAIRSRQHWGRNMIPNNNERTERQSYAAYRLILSWPKRDAQREESRLMELITENANHVTNSCTTQGSDTVGNSANG